MQKLLNQKIIQGDLFLAQNFFIKEYTKSVIFTDFFLQIFPRFSIIQNIKKRLKRGRNNGRKTRWKNN